MKKTFKKILSLCAICCMIFTNLISVQVKGAEIRYQGSDRINTALKIAESGWSGKAQYVVLAAANDEYLLDSLIAAPLAAVYDAPILLNFKGDSLDQNVLNEIKKLTPGKVFIVSSEDVLGKGIDSELATAGISTIRLGKSNFSDTSLSIADAIKSKVGSISKVCLVSDDKSHLADALTVAPIAGVMKMPILLSKQNLLPDGVKKYIKDNSIKSVYAIGGQAVISDDIVKQTGADRIYGADRYETNVKVLNYFKDNLKTDTVFIASGSDKHMVDALSGSVLAAKSESPIVLTGDALTAGTKDYLRNNLNENTGIQILGGSGAVSSAIESNIDAIKNGEEDGLLKIDTVSSVSSKVIKASLKHSISVADKTNFLVTDESKNVLDIDSVQLASWDKENKTVMIALKKSSESGKSYLLNSVKFEANGDDSCPAVTEISSEDYNKVDVTFSKPVRIDSLKAKIYEDYNDNTPLTVSSIQYVDNNPDKIEINTSNQKGATLYKVEFSGAAGFDGSEADTSNVNTFVGTAIDLTTKLSVISAKALDKKDILVTFNTKVKDSSVTNLVNYSVKESYGTDEGISVASARMASVGDESISTVKDAKCSIVLMLNSSMKDSTVYKATVNGLSTSTGVDMDSSSNSADFVGIGPYTTQMDMTDSENVINVLGSRKIKITFKRHMNKSQLTKENFSIINVSSNNSLEISSVNVLDDRNAELEVSGMGKSLYKITVTNLTDSDGNTFAEGKNSKIFEGTEKSGSITGIKSAELSSDNVFLIVTFNTNAGDSAADVSNYTIDNGVGHPYKAEFFEGKYDTVKLTIPKTVKGRLYKLSISGIESADGDKMSSDGITTNFIGCGIDAQNPKINTVNAIDKQTIEIYFDRSVKDYSIDGSGKIWNSDTNTLEKGSLVVIGKYTKNLDSFSNVYVHEDSDAYNGLIVRMGTTEFISGNADSDGTFTINTKLSASNKVSFTPTDIDPQGIFITDVQAINKNTIRVKFDQAVEFESGADFGKIASSSSKAELLESVSRYNSTSGVLKLTKPTAIDTSYKIYDFAVTGGNLTDDNYLVVNPSVRNSLSGGIHDYTKSKVSGYVTLADEDSSSSGVQQMKEFTGSSLEPGVINNVPVIMKDSKTIEICYPEVMNTASASSTLSVLDKKNYKLVDMEGNQLGSNFMLVHVCDISYDLESKKAVISLNSELPESKKGYCIEFANTLLNALGTKYVKQSDGTAVKSQFTLSSNIPQKLMLYTGTSYFADKRTLTIKFNQKATSVTSYDKTVFLADFKITLTDSDGNSYVVQDGDISSIDTTIDDSYSNASDTIKIIFKSSINGYKTIKSGAAGKVEFIENSTLKGVNGEEPQYGSSMFFAQ